MSLHHVLSYIFDPLSTPLAVSLAPVHGRYDTDGYEENVFSVVLAPRE